MTAVESMAIMPIEIISSMRVKPLRNERWEMKNERWEMLSLSTLHGSEGHLNEGSFTEGRDEKLRLIFLAIDIW